MCLSLGHALTINTITHLSVPEINVTLLAASTRMYKEESDHVPAYNSSYRLGIFLWICELSTSFDTVWCRPIFPLLQSKLAPLALVIWHLLFLLVGEMWNLHFIPPMEVLLCEYQLQLPAHQLYNISIEF